MRLVEKQAVYGNIRRGKARHLGLLKMKSKEYLDACEGFIGFWTVSEGSEGDFDLSESSFGTEDWPISRSESE